MNARTAYTSKVETRRILALSRLVSRWRRSKTAPLAIRYLCTQRPVVSLAEGQLAPSGAPDEQTTETKVSSPSQETFFSPTTTRITAFGSCGPAGPCGPTSPFGPGGPADPCGPGGPDFCSQPTKTRLQTAISTAKCLMLYPSNTSAGYHQICAEYSQ
jgi:hypothetical protein